MGSSASKAPKVQPTFFGYTPKDPTTPKPKPTDPDAVPVHPIPPRPPSPQRVIYTLPFTLTLHIVEGATQEDVDDAVTEALWRANQPSTWAPYLIALMRDAWLNVRQQDFDYESDFVPRPDRLPSPPHIRVKCPSILICRTTSLFTWTGDVRWISGELPLWAMNDAAEWRIGERMSGVEIQDAPLWTMRIIPEPIAILGKN